MQNCTIPDSQIKKKHVAIAYHKTREVAAAGIVRPPKIKSSYNFADIFPEAVTGRHIEFIRKTKTINESRGVTTFRNFWFM